MLYSIARSTPEPFEEHARFVVSVRAPAEIKGPFKN